MIEPFYPAIQKVCIPLNKGKRNETRGKDSRIKKPNKYNTCWVIYAPPAGLEPATL